MKSITSREFRVGLGAALDDAIRGEQITITRNARPVAVLGPVDTAGGIDRAMARELGKTQAQKEMIIDDAVRALELLRSGRYAEAEKVLSRVVVTYATAPEAADGP